MSEEAKLRDYARRFPATWKALRKCVAEIAAKDAEIARMKEELRLARMHPYGAALGSPAPVAGD